MAFFIFGILVIILGIIVFILGTKESEPVPTVTGIIVLILGVILFIISFFARIPTGYTGIVTTFGKVHNETLDAGIHTKSPFDTIITMDNREQRLPFTLQAFSSDIQEVSVNGSITLNIDKATAMNLYQDVGTGYLDVLVKPRIEENVKSVFSKYTAEGLIANRNRLSSETLTLLRDNLSLRGLNIISVAIENIDFTDAFTNAVEAKQVAAQRKLTAETEQAQKTMEEEAAAKRAIIAENAKAEQAVIAANADLQVVKIQAEASLYAGQKEAEMNQRIADALTDRLINYYWIKQWNGKLPSTMLGSNPSIMLTMDSQSQEQEQ